MKFLEEVFCGIQKWSTKF